LNSSKCTLVLPFEKTLKFLHCPLVDVEVGVDEINAHHFCQHGRIGLDQVAPGNELAGNAALDRGFDFREFHVERRRVYRGPHLSEFGFGLVSLRNAGIVLFLRGNIVLE
jgi:hypothetical protein